MKERPIIFSSPMVKAILEGRKTMTRRPVKPQPDKECDSVIQEPDGRFFFRYGGILHCPYGIPGDRLWVRETWAPISMGGAITDHLHYKATPNEGLFLNENNIWQETPMLPWLHKWESPIFMPHWASRITLEIMNVRVERLQEITESDAIKEGCYCGIGAGNWRDSKHVFEDLWNSIYGNEAWDKNPWVWVIEFRRII